MEFIGGIGPYVIYIVVLLYGNSHEGVGHSLLFSLELFRGKVEIPFLPVNGPLEYQRNVRMRLLNPLDEREKSLLNQLCGRI